MVPEECGLIPYPFKFGRVRDGKNYRDRVSGSWVPDARERGGAGETASIITALCSKRQPRKARSNCSRLDSEGTSAFGELSMTAIRPEAAIRPPRA